MPGENPGFVTLTVQDLDAGRHDAFGRAVGNILSTEIALETYAQIIDGLPLSDVAWDRYRHKLHPKHPIDSHRELCPGALEKAEEMREVFNINILRIDADLWLLELTAVALHEISVYLFQKGDCVHDLHHTSESSQTIKYVTEWQRPPDDWLPIMSWPTLFTHPGFTAVEQYPNSVADIVGYWAEDRILGGVTLFDHSRTWGADDEPNIYFQSSRPKQTYRIYQLLDDQQQRLLDFLALSIKRDTSEPCPLPLSYSSDNTVRIDPNEAISVYKVYRDPWERVERRIPESRRQFIRDRDVLSASDHPGLEEQLQELLRRST
ncbi:hypothetical protein M426DRAFT_17356 [Hypoxylon sp. CI-4A]|nr:hypothetical protein M426DRAFT_17356 [Hypoxylon sp. CI-4A]